MSNEYRQKMSITARRAAFLRWNLKSKYDLTTEQYEEMKSRQNHQCPICLTTPNPFHVDHDHKTEKVRGLLCRKCNWLLGMADDDISRLERAIEYLKKSASPV